MKNYSTHFNVKEDCWIAKYRELGGRRWKNKWIPKKFKAHQAREAEQWFVVWYAGYLQNGLGPATNDLRVVKTLRTLAPAWLALRDARKIQSSHNYNRLLETAMNSWILDHAKHPHFRIEELDLERAFSVEVVREWIHSIKGRPGSVLSVVGVLRNFFGDMIAEGSLDPNMANPLERPPIVREIKELRALKDRLRKEDGKTIVTTLTADAVRVLCCSRTRLVPMMRQIEYLFTVATAARDNEMRGLTFGDLALDADIPFVHIRWQLLKPGILPPLSYDAERSKGRSRQEIMASPRAVFSPPKFDEIRQVPLHPALVKALRWWKSRGWKQAVGVDPATTSPLFPRDKRSPVPGIFAHGQSAPLLRQDLAALGLPTEDRGKPLVFHSLRHTTGTLLKLEGVAIDDIGELLGHANSGNVTRKHYVDSAFATLYAHVCKLPLAFGDLTGVAEELAG